MRFAMSFACPADECRNEALLSDSEPGPVQLLSVVGMCPTTLVPYTLPQVTEAIARVRADMAEREAESQSILAPPCTGGVWCRCH